MHTHIHMQKTQMNQMDALTLSHSAITWTIGSIKYSRGSPGIALPSSRSLLCTLQPPWGSSGTAEALNCTLLLPGPTPTCPPDSLDLKAVTRGIFSAEGSSLLRLPSQGLPEGRDRCQEGRADSHIPVPSPRMTIAR